ncbi:Holliday junction branch migration protein RuvA [Limimaricola cinnabarinus]|jgi:Holliday junction DNA helicase RuvA|uniref:Holliday junction branch migration complex subunit RuvA n=1 Tax=Limimaricola cinnabarinus TaxID=1125964 RepID=A0A2G1MJ08_9RHOB|nr:Holliday junction branch migration protein RuvA [Limimaricola cinnabarinus]PHP28728.1 Holliday junction branch migration protein RuvA [Limimaricola cinnabarinus]
MIGRIAGRLEYRAADHVLIDVRGVGYVVYVSDRVLAQLPGPGEAVALYTELLVREDILQLFGFPTLVEKEWHRLLLTVQGIGAKASLAILGALGADGLSRAIAISDWSAVARAKGVGPKTAQRVVNELKDKAPSIMAMGAQPAAMPGHEADAVIDDAPADAPAPKPAKKAAKKKDEGNAAAQAEALSALGNLGYGLSEAAAAVAETAHEDPKADTAMLIRAALRKLAPKER